MKQAQLSPKKAETLPHGKPWNRSGLWARFPPLGLSCPDRPAQSQSQDSSAPPPHSESGATTKDLIKSREQDHLNNFSICITNSLYLVLCDFYDQMKLKPNGLNLDATDFTFNLQLSKLRLRRGVRRKSQPLST